MKQDGTVQYPFILDIPESAWEQTGDFHEDGSHDPRSRLSVKIKLAGVMMHVTAIEVKENEDETSPEHGYTQAVNDELESDVEHIWALAGWEGDSPHLLEIEGRAYLITMYPFA